MKQVLSTIVVIQTLAITGCLAIWVPYTQYTSYIPSYTYPVQLQAGDVLSGYLTWPGTSDLDIYLYQDNMDLLSRSTYTDR